MTRRGRLARTLRTPGRAARRSRNRAHRQVRRALYHMAAAKRGAA